MHPPPSAKNPQGGESRSPCTFLVGSAISEGTDFLIDLHQVAAFFMRLIPIRFHAGFRRRPGQKLSCSRALRRTSSACPAVVAARPGVGRSSWGGKAWSPKGRVLGRVAWPVGKAAAAPPWAGWTPRSGSLRRRWARQGAAFWAGRRHGPSGCYQAWPPGAPVAADSRSGLAASMMRPTRKWLFFI